MRLPLILVVAATLTALLVSSSAANPVAAAGGAVVAPPWKNCTQMNNEFPHGVGKPGARDTTSSGPPVKSFSRSTTLYNLAIHNNERLDRDHDGIACERA